MKEEEEKEELGHSYLGRWQLIKYTVICGCRGIFGFRRFDDEEDEEAEEEARDQGGEEVPRTGARATAIISLPVLFYVSPQPLTMNRIRLDWYQLV